MPIDPTPRPGYVFNGVQWVPIVGLKGEPGRSLNIVGPVNTIADLPLAANDGDTYFTLDNGHMHTWSQDLQAFVDAGSVQGPQGIKGDPGQTFTVKGIVADIAHLPASVPDVPGQPDNRDVYVTQDTVNLYVNNPSSPVAIPAGQPGEGWVNMGRVQGPPGQDATIRTPVADVASLPTAGNLPGDMRIVAANGHLYGWDDVNSVWVDGGLIRPQASGVGAWTAQPYPAGSIVIHQNALWWANSQSTAQDAPNTPRMATVRVSSGTNVVNSSGNLDDPAINWANLAATLGIGDFIFITTNTGNGGNWPYTPSSGYWAGQAFTEVTWAIWTKNPTLGRQGWMLVPNSATTPTPGAGNYYDLTYPVADPWTLLTPNHLAQMLDVDVTSIAPLAGEVLTWNGVKWVPAGTSASISTLGDIPDVDAPTIPNDAVLRYDGTAQKWVVGTAPADKNLVLGDLTDVDTTAPSLLDVLAWTGTGWSNTPYPRPSLSLEDLNDTEVVNIADGDALVYDHATSEWVNKPVVKPAQNSLLNLTDTDVQSARGDDVLRYDEIAQTWVPGQAVTPAELDARVNALVAGVSHGIAVNDYTETPPATPANGDVYIVKGPATGAFNGQANQIATWHNGAWVFTAPSEGDTHLNEADGKTYTYSAANGWVVTSSSSGGGGGGGEKVGTIIQSVLTEVEFAAAYPADHTKWRLCDGRACPGTRYATITGQNSVPDLRGAYLRMAGNNAETGRTHWQGGAIRTFFDWLTGRPKAALSMSTSGNHAHTAQTAGAHTHGFYVTDGGGQTSIFAINTNGQEVSDAYIAAGENNWFTWRGSRKGTKSNIITEGNSPHQHPTDQQGNHTHQINGGGDAETRPTTYTVSFFVKVDD